jgi:hypothetical protein
MFDKKVPNRWTWIRMPPRLVGVSVVVAMEDLPRTREL